MNIATDSLIFPDRQADIEESRPVISSAEQQNSPHYHIAFRLLEIAEQTAALSSSSLKTRVAAHFSGMNELLDANRGFLSIVKKNRPGSTKTRDLRITSQMCFDAHGDGELSSEPRACLDDPALIELLRGTGHRSCLLGAPGDERSLVALYPLDDQTELALSFERAPTFPAFSDQDRENLLFALRRQGSFYRRIARELGALDAEKLLSPREQEVLGLLLTGLSEKEIANRLGMTVRSAHQRVTALYRNFSVRSRPELMALLLHPC